MRLQVDDRYDGFVDEIVRDGEWRDEREDRELNDVVTSFNFTAPSQSMWPLDAADDFASRTAPTKTGGSPTHTVRYRIGGLDLQNTEGGEGILQNSVMPM